MIDPTWGYLFFKQHSLIGIEKALDADKGVRE
jgi:hypothetical protein